MRPGGGQECPRSARSGGRAGSPYHAGLTGWKPVSRLLLAGNELPGGAEEVGGEDFAGGFGVGGLGGDVEEGPVGEFGVLEGVGAVVGLAEGEAGIEDEHALAGGVEGIGIGEDGDGGGGWVGVGAEGEGFRRPGEGEAEAGAGRIVSSGFEGLGDEGV